MNLKEICKANREAKNAQCIKINKKKMQFLFGMKSSSFAFKANINFKKNLNPANACKQRYKISRNFQLLKKAMVQLLCLHPQLLLHYFFHI